MVGLEITGLVVITTSGGYVVTGGTSIGVSTTGGVVGASGVVTGDPTGGTTTGVDRVSTGVGGTVDFTLTVKTCIPNIYPQFPFLPVLESV